MKTEILLPDKKGISLAAYEIKNGGLVAFPTETVYGLGADAFNSEAVAKIYIAKGRPSDNPLIVHLADIDAIQTVGYLPDKAGEAVRLFMPGPLTIVVGKNAKVPDIVTGGLPTVAVRIPVNETARQFLAACGTAVAAPSANTSTRPSPTAAAHVYDDLNGKIRYILDGGNCEIGLESTILDFTTDKIRLLRRGGIPLEKLTAALGKIEVYTPTGGRPLSPGMKYRHYAPSAKVVLFEYGEISAIKEEYQKAKSKGERAAVFTLSGTSCFFDKDDCLSQKPNYKKLYGLNNGEINDKGLSGGAGDIVVFATDEEYARRLFFELRRIDGCGVSVVFCELAKDSGLGQSVNSRLLKSSGGNVNG